MNATSPITIATFLAYIVGVFVLAGFSHRLLSGRGFVGEYFLGSRGLGSWALAFTFAATSASGGSFTGFPSLIYSHGWILAFWIASYMIVPLCTMGILGKRLNMVARKSGAITIPDVLRDRHESTTLGLLATCTIIFFTVSNLVAQFKAGAIIIEKTFNLPTEWGSFAGQSWAYLVGLLIFAGVVVIYTSYGGFRAVVWTDVMQGVVMGAGIIILLPVIINHAGGLSAVNEKIRNHPPHLVTSLPGKNNDLAFLLNESVDPSRQPAGVAFIASGAGQPYPAVKLVRDDTSRRSMIEIHVATNNLGQPTTTANEIRDLVLADATVAPLLADIRHAYDNNGTGTWDLAAELPQRMEWRFIRGEEFLFGPGRQSDGSPFHPLGMAISFFFMWAISGAGQPATMVRLMAFKESATLRRAIITVTIYYALIYLPMVFIFVAARTLLPYIPQEDSDNAMVLVATRVVADMSWGHAILAAIFVAAPFAAVMSTVDSFLLIVSSCLVRDIYQRTINPNVSERAAKWASYATTAIVGVIVTVLATRRIDFLQYIIVFTGGGFAATFLCPVFLSLYWKGMTRQGTLAAMVGGFLTIVGLFAPSMFGSGRIDLLGLHPIFWGLFVSLTLGIVVSKLTGPPPAHLVAKYFHRSSPATESK